MTKRKQVIFSSALGIVLLVVIFLPHRKGEVESLDEVEVVDSAGVEEIVYRYGIPMNDYEVDLKKGLESISEYLKVVNSIIDSNFTYEYSRAEELLGSVDDGKSPKSL